MLKLSRRLPIIVTCNIITILLPKRLNYIQFIKVDDIIIDQPKDIIEKFVDFFHNLLNRLYLQVDLISCYLFIKSIDWSEIWEAMRTMGYRKSLDIFITKFYRGCWDTISNNMSFF